MRTVNGWILVLAVASSALWIGCSDDTEGEGGDGGLLTCDPGFVAIGDECRRVDDGNNTVNNGPNNSPNNDPNNSPNNDPNNSPNNDGPCVQGQSRCLDVNNLERCDAQGMWTAEPCPDETLCDDGSCRPPSCEPGSVLGCAGQFSLALCNETGTGTVPEVCPDGLGCRDGVCTDQICDPGETSCLNTEQLRICNDEGTGYVEGDECGAGTACDNGTCRSLCEINAKVTSYLGCDYWSIDLDNVESGQTQAHAVVVSNPSPNLAAEITITRTDGQVLSFPNLTVAPQGQEVYLINTGSDIDGSGLWSGRAWRIDSSIPVTVHQFNPLNGEGVFTNDASLLLPSNATGEEYIVMSWRHRGGGLGASLSGFVTMVAVEEGSTSVTVTPTAAVAPGNGVPALAPGQTWTTTLAQGQVLSLSTSGPEGADLTGTSIVSTNRLAVFGGHECANVPSSTTNYCDHLEQQIFPVASWGQRYIGVPFKPRNSAQQDTWVVVAGASGVQITTNPPLPISGLSLSRGQKVEFNTNQPFELTSTGPVLLGQFMHGSNYPGFTQDNRCGGGFGGTGIGDPAFTLAVPVSQYRPDYIVLTPGGYVDDSLNIIAPLGAAVTVDGQPVNTLFALGNTGYAVGTTTVTDGVHRIESDQPFGLISYGYDCDVSYAYPGGLNLEAQR